MGLAVEAVHGGQPLKLCARLFGIPVNTLRRHSQTAIRKPGVSMLGRTSLLGKEAELELVEYILYLVERGFGLTPKNVRTLHMSTQQEMV
jgi:hypothetical protein